MHWKQSLKPQVSNTGYTSVCVLRDFLLTVPDRGSPRCPLGERRRLYAWAVGSPSDDVVPIGSASIHYGEIYTRYGFFASEPLSHVRPRA